MQFVRLTGGEDGLNVLNKADKRQVNCYIIIVIEMSNLQDFTGLVFIKVKHTN